MLAFFLISFFIFALGFMLYVHKIMVEYKLSWELQLTTLGLILFIVSLAVSKMLSKVEFNE
jgi:Mn2+/Fe2+ NRAMP family transporter